MPMQPYCVIVAGPTGVGKSEFAEKLAREIDGEIINGDLGQFYTPLTIGTAKPAWRRSDVAHHLFDILDSPVRFSVMAFRQRVIALCDALWQRNKIPIIVGGSVYYIAALFFPPAAHATTIQKRIYDSELDIWKQLFAIDPVRAQEIDPHDRYRIERALDIWYSTGIKPSLYKPVYDPIAPYLFIWVNRDRDDLYHRINERVTTMMDQGWVAEVQGLLGSTWEPFLQQKKIIGYPEVVAYCHSLLSQDQMLEIIKKKSRNYAKRQITFWRMFRKKLEKGLNDNKKEVFDRSIIQELNLTHAPIDRYIKQLRLLIMTEIRKSIDTE
jgi:tRNA dimethylallyltransferase